MSSKVAWHDVAKIVAAVDYPANEKGSGNPDDVERLRSALVAYFADKEASLAVLGLDIYQYSRMPNEHQRLVPTLFKLLNDVSLDLCLTKEASLFQHDRSIPFVSTGDGGFQMFATPLHAVVYAAYFEVGLAAFNGYYLFPALRRLMGAISIRYAVTYDLLVEQDGNLYGAAIINNARILARDSLNRFLLDHRSVEWFQENMVTLESLLTLRAGDLKSLPALAGYDLEQVTFTYSGRAKDMPQECSRNCMRTNLLDARQQRSSRMLSAVLVACHPPGRSRSIRTASD
jgi:hypothetical protein